MKFQNDLQGTFPLCHTQYDTSDWVLLMPQSYIMAIGQALFYFPTTDLVLLPDFFFYEVHDDQLFEPHGAS